MAKRGKTDNRRVPQARLAVSIRSAPPLGVLAGAAIIALIAFLVYFPSLNGGFVLDDNALLTESGPISASNGLYQFWCTNEPIDYWPASNTTFWLEWRLWEMRTTGYHVTNLILHIAESLLVWVILRKLSIPGAFWAAIIFAVHPVNVEAVAWISQRKEVAAMLFFLLSILWYLKSETTAASSPNLPCRLSFNRWYWISLLAFVSAMLAKGSAAVLPGLILGIVWWMRPLRRGDFVRIAPFFLVGAALALVNVWFQRHGAVEVIRAAGFAERLAGTGCVAWFYLYKAVLPIDLSFVYSQWKIEAVNPLWWAPLLAALAVTGVLWAYRRSWGRPLLFAWGFFCVSLLPVTGISDVGFMKYTLVADRYQHIAIIGVIALAAAGLDVWHKRARGGSRRAATAAAVVAVGAFALLTLRQSGLYHDAKTLYETTLVKNPDCWVIRSLLGCILIEEKKLPEAMEQFERAIRLNPNFADAHSNLAMALDQSKRSLEAVGHCEEALRLKPIYPKAHHNLGIALAHLGRLGEAIEHYKKALEEEPFFPEAENSLGAALVRTDRPKEALEHYQKALTLKPDFADARFNLGEVLASLGRFQEAIEQYRQALALNPNDADTYYLMGNALIEVGRPGEAIGYFQQALRLKPDYAAVYNSLGGALIRMGRAGEGIAQYQQALRFRPDYADVYFNLALVYASLHQSSQAVSLAQKALELARSKGQTALAKQTEDWLNSYRAGLPDLQKGQPSSK
ncbi:MAG: tetratricopeptide repeat protein [Thermoguttaceae bacterium]